MTPPNATEVEVLVQRADWIRALAQALVHDEHEAEDLAQDAWVVALTRSARTSEGWASWLGATMRNLARSRWRGERRREARECDAARPEAELSSAEMLEQLDAHEGLVRAVRALDEPYRTAILLRYFEGLSPREIAAREHVSVKTVDTRLYRALGRLRQQLDRRHDGDRRAWLALLCPLMRPKHVVAAGAVAMGVKVTVAAVVVVVVAVLWFARERSASRANVVGAPQPAEVARELASPAESPAPEASQRASVDAPAEVAKTKPALGENVKAASALRVAGLAVDVGDQPVGGLHVVGRASASSTAPTVAEAMTDASGSFELTLRDGVAWLDIEAPPWTVVLRPRVSYVADKPHVFVLAPRRGIAGVVVDADGLALASVEVRCTVPRTLRASIGRVLDLSINEIWATQSDAAGAFSFAAAPDLEGCELLARAPGYDEARAALASGNRLDLRVVLARHAEPAKHVIGRVVDARGDPVEGAFVAFEDMAAAGHLSNEAARTDARGRFDVPVESAVEGPRKLVALAAGRMPAALESGWDPAEHRQTWPQPIELVVEGDALAITGRVVHDDGTPVPGAIVAHVEATAFPMVPWATLHDGSTTWAGLSTEELLRGSKVRDTFTDKSGRFELGGLLAKPYRLQALDPLTLDIALTEPIAAGRGDVEIRMPTSERIDLVAGRIVDAAGQPVRSAQVWLARRAPDGGGEFGRTPEPRSKSMTTDANGGFEFRRVSRAVEELVVQAPESGSTQRFALSSFDDLAHIEVSIARACNFKIDLTGSALTAASFRVLDAGGAALMIMEARGKEMSAATLQSLQPQGTGTLLVSDVAAVVVFLDANDVEIARVPLALKPGELTIVRP